MPTCDYCLGRGKWEELKTIRHECGQCKGTGRWPPDSEGDVMETKTCGECKWADGYEGMKTCMNPANQQGMGTHCVMFPRVLPDFSCPRFERKADWVDGAWAEYNTGCGSGVERVKEVFRKHAEAEFERRRKETP